MYATNIFPSAQSLKMLLRLLRLKMIKTIDGFLNCICFWYALKGASALLRLYIDFLLQIFKLFPFHTEIIN